MQVCPKQVNSNQQTNSVLQLTNMTTLRRKGSKWNLKRFYQRYVFGTPKRFYTELF